MFIKNSRNLFFVGIFIFISIIGGLYFYRIPRVLAVLEQKGDIAEIVYATGVVEPVFWAKVSPLLRERVISHCNCEGKEVKKGDVLAQLDDMSIKAELQQIVAKRDFAKKEFQRLKDLIQQGSATRQNLERAEAELVQLENQILATNAHLDDYILFAPIDGVVLREDGQVGDISNAGDVLFWIGRPSPLRIVAEINEEDLPKVAIGQKILLRNEGFLNGQLLAELDSITPKGDPIAKIFRAYFSLPKGTPLKIGMSVEANIITKEKKNASLLPIEAIKTSDKGEAYIYTIDGNRVKILPVKFGIKGGRFIEIIEPDLSNIIVISPVNEEYKDGAFVIQK